MPHYFGFTIFAGCASLSNYNPRSIQKNDLILIKTIKYQANYFILVHSMLKLLSFV